MSGRVLITGGTVVDATGSRLADVLVESGRVAAVDPGIDVADAERVDARGLLVVPGGIDPHTHLDYDTGAARTADDFESGSRSAAFGGTTTILDFAFQHKNESPIAAFEEWRGRAAKLAEAAGATVYIVRLSTGDGLDEATAARERGVRIPPETRPQYLFLDDSAYETDDLQAAAGFIMSPPLRPFGHRERLSAGVIDGRIETTGSDHRGFCRSEKTMEPAFAKRADAADFSKVPNGAPGIFDRFPPLLDAALRGRMSLERFVSVASTRSAEIFGLKGRKGRDPSRGRRRSGVDRSRGRMDDRHARDARQRRLRSVRGSARSGKDRIGVAEGAEIVDGDRWLGRAGGGEYLIRGGVEGWGTTERGSRGFASSPSESEAKSTTAPGARSGPGIHAPPGSRRTPPPSWRRPSSPRRCRPCWSTPAPST